MSIYLTWDTIVSDIIKTKRVAELKRNKELRRKEREAIKRENPNRYYVYAFYREDGTPYYIGKGCGGRMYRKRQSGEVNPPQDKSRIKTLEYNLTEDDAYELEKYYISLYGRKDINTGILRNRSEGGKGSTGSLGVNKLVENGNWHLSGSISCINKKGTLVIIPNNIYQSQVGDYASWEYVLPHSFEGHVRKCRVKGDNSSVEELHKTYCATTCVDKSGKVVKISKEAFHNQIASNSEKEYVTINSAEGRIRLGIQDRSDICVVNKKGERVLIDKELYKLQERTKKLGVNLSANEYVNPRSKEGQYRISLLECTVKNTCGVKGGVYVINTLGEVKNISTEDYKKLRMSPEKEWCYLQSTEGKLRKSKITGKPVKESHTKGKMPVISKRGLVAMILSSEYHSQIGDKNDWEWVVLRSREGKKRRLLNKN